MLRRTISYFILFPFFIGQQSDGLPDENWTIAIYSRLDHNYTVLCLSIKGLNSRAVNLSRLHTLVSD